MSDTERPEDEQPKILSEDEIDQWFEDEQEDEGTATQDSSPVSRTAIEKKYAEGQLRIVRTSHDFPLHFLKDSLKDSNYINMSPTYQRRDRWDRGRRSRLIESFLMNIPVPPIFLYENTYNQYEVMDGRQRLEAIRDFLENKFELTGLEFWKELKGQRFSDLDPTLQKGLLRRPISAIVLLAETSRPDQSAVDIRMVLFQRLNTGGTRLNPQELRNAIYPSAFNKMLADLAREPLFTSIWRIPPRMPGEKENPPPDLLKNPLFKTMADCELVLRFYSIRETIELSLKGSLSRLLDKCMIRHASDTDLQLDRHKTLFLSALGTLHSIFKEETFVLPSTDRLSRPLYDALMVAVSFNEGVDLVSRATEIKERLAAAFSDPKKYDVLIGRGNTVEAIKSRVNEATKILLGEGGE